MQKINVGIIGCGRISDLHYPGYLNNRKARIYAVCDTRIEIAKQKKKEWKARKSYNDYNEMLRDPSLDAVEILSPHLLHESMVIDAARAGKHIALQKPMTISLKSADRMLKAVEKAGMVFRVSDNYLFYPPIVLAKKMIDNGDIGTPSNLRIKFVSGQSGGWHVPSSAWKWRLKEKEAGRGMHIFDHGHHLWAVAWYLLGDVERISSWIDSVDGIVECPAAIMWKYREGVKYGMCEYAHASEMSIPSKYYANDEWFEITGSRGIIAIHRCTGNINTGPGLSIFTGKKWKHYPGVKTDWGEGFIGSTHNFIESIQGNSEPTLSGRQGRDILKFAFAISRSSNLRREVYMDEMDLKFPGLFTRRRIRQEIKKKQSRKNIMDRIRFGTADSGYAGKARQLTIQLVNRFDPSAAGDWGAEIGLCLLAEGTYPEIQFSLSIKNGKAQIEEGSLPPNPSLLLKVDPGTWAEILLGKKGIETAFAKGKLDFEGSIEEGLKLKEAFGI